MRRLGDSPFHLALFLAVLVDVVSIVKKEKRAVLMSKCMFFYRYGKIGCHGGMEYERVGRVF